MSRILAISFLLFLCVLLNAQPISAQPAERRITRNEYIEKYKDAAIREMHLYGVPASITLAQGILESADGNSPLAMYAKNHFGIKCHSAWKGETFIMDDDEKNECFRKYNDVEESFKDHSEFLANRSRYADLFALKVTDYKGWANGLKKAGYATNPKYAKILIDLIEQHELFKYDHYAKVPPRKANKTKTSSILASTKNNRLVKLHNNVKYIVAKDGDDAQSIADEFNMNLWQINKYNDLNKFDKVHSGDVVYLQPKKGKAKTDFHLVKDGETMRSISQFYGIKLKQLYKKNNLVIGSQPRVGEKLYLRRKKK